MGLMILEDFREKLVFDLKNRSDSGLTDSVLDRWIGWAYNHCSNPGVFHHRELQYSFTQALVSGTDSYTWTSDGAVSIVSIRFIHHIQALVDTPTATRVKLLPRGIAWMDERSRTSGAPRLYAIDGSLMYLDPVPGANETGQLLKLRTWRRPAALVAGAATVIQEQWDEVISLGARWRAERDLGYRDLAELTKQDYAALINEYSPSAALETEDYGWSPGLTREDYMETS